MDVRIYNQNISSDFTGNRNHLIKSLIMKYDADICLFQECAPWSCRKGDTAIDKVMAPEYAEAFVDIENVNYTPVYYKKERFEEVETGYVLYAGLNDCDSKGLTWCVLREKTSGKLTAVASTHFWWQDQKKEDDLQRVENAKEAIKACQEVMEKYGLPVVIAGDLNCGPGATQGLDGYNEMIKGGMIDVRHTATESTDLHTHHCDVKLDENGIAYGGEMPNLTMDHAFLSHKCADIVFNKFAVLTEEDALNSSDHCPLLIEYTVK